MTSSASSSGTFLRRLLLAALLTALAVEVALLWLAAAPERSRNPLEQEVAAELLAGRNVVMPTGLNEAALRWLTASRLRVSPEVALLGSSHGLRIDESALGGRMLANFSISGGTFSDHLITHELLLRGNVRPKVWLITVDAWYFDRIAYFPSWMTRSDEIISIQQRLSRFREPPLQPLYSPPRTFDEVAPGLTRYTLTPLLAAVDYFLGRLFGGPVTTTRTDVHGSLLFADGSLHPAPEYRQPAASDVERLARRQFAESTDRYRYGTYREIDRELWQLFERWVQFLRRDGSDVWLLLTPYHPAIYSDIVQSPDNQLKALESRTRALAAQAQAKVIGSYDPRMAGVEPVDFADGDHLVESGLRRLLEPAVDAPPRDLR